MSNNFSRFKPAWWLSGAHAQTIWPPLFRIRPKMAEVWERVELPDGDFLDCVWDGKSFPEKNRPIVLLLHGLEGGIESAYPKSLMTSLTQRGFRPVLMHFRTCSGAMNRLERTYCAGDAPDVDFVVKWLKERYPMPALHAVGYSIGANVLLRWLGETETRGLASAVAVSVPFLMGPVADRLMTGFSKVYQWNLLSSLKRKYKQKFADRPCPFDLKKIDTLRNFWEFDNFVTAPLHGYKDVHDYYNKSSCRHYLPGISVKTLIIHAKDDPFMKPEVIPEKGELSPTTELILTERGGHVGFAEGAIPFWPHYWLDKTIVDFLIN